MRMSLGQRTETLFSFFIILVVEINKQSVHA